METQFTKENIVEAYQLLNHGATAEVKKQADDFLNDFLVRSTHQASPAAWLLSRELVTGPFSRDVRFVGLNVLYKKALQDFGSLAAADKATLVAFLRSVVRGLAAEQDSLLASMAARAYAAVGILQVVCGDDPQIMNEVLEQVKAPPSDDGFVLLLLQLINAFPEELHSLIIERSNQNKVLAILKEHRPSVAAFWTGLLSMKKVPGKVVEQILEGISSWTVCKVNLLAEIEMVETLLRLYPQDDYFQAINDIFVSMLERVSIVSEFSSKPIEEILSTLEKAIQIRQPEVQELLKSTNSDQVEEVCTLHSVQAILNFLLQVVGPKFSEHLNKKKSRVAKCFAETYVVLLKSFPSFLYLTESPASKEIYKYAVMLLQHADNAVSNFSLDLWLELHRTLVKQQRHLTARYQAFFLQVFDEVAAS